MFADIPASVKFKNCLRKLIISGRKTCIDNLKTTASKAISLTVRIRELGKYLTAPEFKRLLADLSLELARAELTIADLIYENSRMEEKMSRDTKAAGDISPKCRNRTYELISSKPHPTFGEIGYREREYKCSGCCFTKSTIIA